MSHTTWSVARPDALVIACSDGRLQVNIDDFLQNHLGITYYDRMYVPGGPGALASSGLELLRADQLRRECDFLIQAHGTEEVILIFHGAGDDGPAVATCADYMRKLPGRTPEEIRDQQQADVSDLLTRVFIWHQHLRIRVYRAEVADNGSVHFVDLIQG